MTRLQAGLDLRLDWVDPTDVIRSAITRSRAAHPLAQIRAELPDLPMLRAEAALLEQCLVNLLDNAVKFSDAPAQVRGSQRSRWNRFSRHSTAAQPIVPAPGWD